MDADLEWAIQEIKDLHRIIAEQGEMISEGRELTYHLNQRLGELEDNNQMMAEQIEILQALTEPRRSQRLRGRRLGRRGVK